MSGTQARKIDARAICSPVAASEAASAPIGMFSAPAGDPCESAGISAHPLTPAEAAAFVARSGDVLRKGRVTRTIERHWWHGNFVPCEEVVAGHLRRVVPFISQFRRWLVGATIVSRGPQ